MNVLIMGCGRVGARVATALSASHQVTVVDWNSSSFDRLGPDFHGETVVGNGMDADVLKGAGVREADLFLALTDGDNLNLMTAQIAKHFGVGHVLARVYDPVRARLYAKMGLVTFSPTLYGAERLFAMIVGESEEK